ncbi:hypothetical protein ACWTQY_30250, partial [Klebsiella pneumoniae]
IFSVSAWTPRIEIPASYPHDVYLSYRALSWGWATWADRWNKIDWDVRDYAAFREDARAQALFARGGDDPPGRPEEGGRTGEIRRAEGGDVYVAWRDLRYARGRFALIGA